MRKLQILFILLAGFIFTGKAFAQVPALGMGAPGLILDPPDTLYLGQDSTLSFTMNVVNKGTASFSGKFAIQQQINNEAFYYVLTVVNIDDLGPGDTVKVVKEEIILPNTQKYKGGDNVIVIWPKADDASVLSVDSVIDTIYIDGIVNRDEPKVLNERLNVYPNPVKELLRLDFRKDAQKLEYVRVFGMLGQELFYTENIISEIDVRQFNGRLIFLEVRYKDGIRGTYKILIEH